MCDSPFLMKNKCLFKYYGALHQIDTLILFLQIFKCSALCVLRGAEHQ